jgi:hypothetical protein
MRILQTLAWVLVALACAAPACDTHDGTIGSGSGSSAWSRMPSTASGAAPDGSATQHQEVVHAMESVTGASLEPAKPKAAKLRPARKQVSGGNGGRSSSSPSTPSPPPEPELPDSGRMLGQKCWRDDQCASNMCTFEVCAKAHYDDKVTKGEKCDYDSQCVSNHCYEDKCE